MVHGVRYRRTYMSNLYRHEQLDWKENKRNIPEARDTDASRTPSLHLGLGIGASGRLTLPSQFMYKQSNCKKTLVEQ